MVQMMRWEWGIDFRIQMGEETIGEADGCMRWRLLGLVGRRGEERDSAGGGRRLRQVGPTLFFIFYLSLSLLAKVSVRCTG